MGVFHCVNCGHESETFDLDIAGRDQGGFTYRAKCPECGSIMVNVLPGTSIEELKITIGK